FTGDFQFSQRSIVVEIATIKMFGAGEVCLSCVGLQTKRRFNRRLGGRQTSRGVIESEEVKVIMRVSELALREEERRITFERLFQWVHSFAEVLSANGTKARDNHETFGATVEIVRDQISGRRLLDRILFLW